MSPLKVIAAKELHNQTTSEKHPRQAPPPFLPLATDRAGSTDGREAGKADDSDGRIPYFITFTVSEDGIAAERYTRSVAFWKSDSRASLALTNFCGLRSVSGNHVLWT